MEQHGHTSLHAASIAMCPSVDRPMPHLSLPDNVTTINYALDWPHLENPSNTTFAGQSQIDICRCPRADLSPQKASEPGHIYTRFRCVGPAVHFKTADDLLWVLDAPRGPLNMLRPATSDEHNRRRRIHDAADPAAYQDATFLFLTGPCPRGRYQAYATRTWLQSLSPLARGHVSSLCLLIQPYEEDGSDDATRRAYAHLADYIVHTVPALKALYLYVCPNGMRMWNAAREFSILLRSNDHNTKIIVAGDDAHWSPAKGPTDVTPSDESSEHDQEIKKSPRGKSEDDSVDGEWIDATLSPTSPHKETDTEWQLL
ncbi:hypothetical protein ACJQWK_02867 [Exserohilum turcicum]